MYICVCVYVCVCVPLPEAAKVSGCVSLPAPRKK